MITVQRFNRIRTMLEQRARSMADNYGFIFGGFNSFTDKTNLLGPEVSPELEDLFCRNNYKHARFGVSCLWAFRKYLNLIENHSPYRTVEVSEDNRGAFPDIDSEGHKRKELSPARYYVWESEKRLRTSSAQSS